MSKEVEVVLIRLHPIILFLCLYVWTVEEAVYEMRLSILNTTRKKDRPPYHKL